MKLSTVAELLVELLNVALDSLIEHLISILVGNTSDVLISVSEVVAQLLTSSL
jgi:hypothetical protein